jgi:protein disulfide-isomerase
LIEHASTLYEYALVTRSDVAPQHDQVLQNQTMQQIFKVQGYPTVHLVIPEPQQDGTVTFTSLGQSGYAAGGPESWCATAGAMIKK